MPGAILSVPGKDAKNQKVSELAFLPGILSVFGCSL